AGGFEAGRARRATPYLQVRQHPERAVAVLQHPLHASLRQAEGSRRLLPATSIEPAQAAIDGSPQAAVAVMREAGDHTHRHALRAAEAAQAFLRELADACLEVADPQATIAAIEAEGNHVGGGKTGACRCGLPLETPAVEAVQARTRRQPQHALAVLDDIPDIPR